MKVVEENKEIHLSIKDVIFASSDRRFYTSSIPLRIRASKGTDVHVAFQDKRSQSEKNFQKEAAVKIKLEVMDWKFIISGRADVIFEKQGKLIIEEIKSVTNLEKFDLSSRIAEEYRQQLLMYGHYYKQLGREIVCRLVLVDIYSEDTEIIEIEPQDLTNYIQQQCQVILTSWKQNLKQRDLLKKRAKTIQFPFSDHRPNQKEIIEKISEILSNQGRLMLLAPSGLGKTIGTLYPALKYSLRHNKRLFIVTSKTTQQNIYRETLQIFAKKKGQFSSIILTAKEKMCVNDAFICEKSFCPFIENYENAPLDEITSEVSRKQVVDARIIRKIAKKHTVCPFELSLDYSLECDVIVGDYNYVFHPFIKLKRYFDQPYDDMVLIVDEAHNLPSRAMTYYSPEITLKSITDTIESLRALNLPKKVERKGLDLYQKVNKYLLALIKEYPDIPNRKIVLTKFDKKFFRTAVKDSDRFVMWYVQAYIDRMGYQPGGKDRNLEFTMNLRNFYLILKESDLPEYSELLYLKEGKMKILCKSAAHKLEYQLQGFNSVIMQSATLFPMEYFQKMLGFPESAVPLQFNSPYAQQNRLYLLMPNISTKYEYRRDSYEPIAALICDSVALKYGNYLAFFPSFKYLKAVEQEIEKKSLSVELLVQDRNMSERKRREYLKKLQSPDKKYLLLGVHGGIFSEGVDFTGDMAIGAFIIGPGLPAYSLEQEMMKNYFDFKWQKGFEYAYRNPGITKVIQSAGRVFRTFTDRGFVILIGQRFITPFYKDILPQDWLIERPDDIIGRISSFWNDKSPKIITKSNETEEKYEKPNKKKSSKKKYPKTVDLFDLMEKL
ncbi:ATP-dependent DNA helicase [Candidatus Lokiarchaeum ossiferum]|uniref:ATP-dependent DNA helicase n=1 Tax=Candidatus Lokiarchaeum ossiferum TaxID=2951803 RepID=UPI00352D558C